MMVEDLIRGISVKVCCSQHCWLSEVKQAKQRESPSAIMWAGTCIYSGQNGYPLNTEKSRNIANGRDWLWQLRFEGILRS